MSIKVISTAYGPPATERLSEQINELKNGNPLAPVTVVVPTNPAGLAIRRTLGSRGKGIVAVDFPRMADLGALLGKEEIGEGRERVSDMIIGAAMRRALASNPGVFANSAEQPATEQALVRVYSELREASDSSLDVLAGQSDRAKDVVRLYRQVRSDLQEKWYDEQDLYDRAIEGLESGSLAAKVAELGPVVVYLPQRVSRSQGQVIQALAETTTVVAIVGLTGKDQADAPVRDSITRMGGTISTAISAGTPGERRIISASNVDEEARIAVREVVQAARDGIPLDRIAVLCGGGQSAVRQVQDQLAAAGIPFNGPSGKTLADTLVGRGILALFDLKARDFRRDEVFALLSTAEAKLASNNDDAEYGKTKRAPVEQWERISRSAGVARFTDQWKTRLDKYIEDLHKSAKKYNIDPDYVKKQVGRTKQLRDFIVRLESDLSPDPAPTTWRQRCVWVERLIKTYLGDGNVRQRWPDAERQAGKEIVEILNRLAKLGSLERDPSLATFRRALACELGAPTGRVGRLGHGVLTDSIGASVGLELDRLILVGLAEGTFPHSSSDDALLPEGERKATGDDMLLVVDQLAEQHRSLMAALSSAQSSALVYARGDSRASTEQYPSRWLLDEATRLAGNRVEATSLETYADQEWFEHVPSFWGRVEGADFPATCQEFRLKALAEEGLAAQEVRDNDTALSRGAEMVEARASNNFTRFDGNLAGVELSELTKDPMSPTSLETWSDCPMRYFFRHVLGVDTLDKPEDLLEISPKDKGSLIHKILERFIVEQLDNHQVPGPEEPWNEQQRSRLQEIGKRECKEAEDRGLTGASLYWQHDCSRILANLDRFIQEDNKMRKGESATPMASELAFGVPREDGKIVQDAVKVDLPNGRTVQFKGQADRVDRGADGKLLVTDYKTGNTDGYGELNKVDKEKAVDPFQRGTRLQLPVYGLAARDSVEDDEAQVKAQYCFLTDDGKSRRYGYTLTEEVMDRFLQTVATFTEGVESGVFCDRPDPKNTGGPNSQYCDYCNFDRLGTVDGRRKWDRMLDGGALADYRNLAELSDDEDEKEKENR